VGIRNTGRLKTLLREQPLRIMRESKRYSVGQKRALVDIDETISTYPGKRIYELAVPLKANIGKINKMHSEGWHITYWTARGASSKIDTYALTVKQLNEWGCKFDDLIVGYREEPYHPTKPHFDMVIDDKAKRIEEI
jgi:hypothetical protein